MTKEEAVTAIVAEGFIPVDFSAGRTGPARYYANGEWKDSPLRAFCTTPKMMEEWLVQEGGEPTTCVDVNLFTD